ncbi:MAG: hypothetical protein ACRBEE_09110 [Arenicella sp.]
METTLLNEVIECLPKGKTHFRYFKGAYASQLLSLLTNDTLNVREVRKTRFKPLIEHSTLKPIIANCGGGVLKKEVLDNVWNEPSHPFLLSVSRWGGKTDRAFYQTSRFGENLVLQLNLPMTSQVNFKRWICADRNDSINGEWSCHPVQSKQGNPNFRDTLAWSRIDLDFQHNEALIEEIQSDGVRNIKRWYGRSRSCCCQNCTQIKAYLHWFDSYSSIWSESMLMATIWFIKEELGIDRIYMHTARSGWQVKKMNQHWQAPRSLYSDLPKKFAFKQTWAAPEFLLKTRCYQRLIRSQPDIDFYQLHLNKLL